MTDFGYKVKHIFYSTKSLPTKFHPTEVQVYNLLDLDMPAKNKPFTEQQMVVDHQKALVYILDRHQFSSISSSINRKFLRWRFDQSSIKYLHRT
jgi:hypothetical protein